MKKLVLLVLVAVNFSIFANSEKPAPKKKNEIRSEIVKLLKNSDFDMTENFKATVDILINKKGELIVLEVNSKNGNAKDFITSKLNYKKVATGLQEDVTIYKMPLKVVIE